MSYQALVDELNALLRLKTTVTAMKLFERVEDMAAIPRLRRPKAIHTTDQIVSMASRLGWTVGVTAEDLAGAQCRAVIGLTAQDGVIDPYHRVHGYPGLHIVDGSTITANPGVNPSLTITAMAERAMSLWPNAGQPDPRPAPGAGYRRVAPVPPRSPVVPDHAPGALRLPVDLGMPEVRPAAGP